MSDFSLQTFQGTRGVRLAAQGWGDPAAPPVLLLHGLGQSRHAWRGTAQRLSAAGYFALAPDARGHGDSDPDPSGRYTLDDFVADARIIARQLGEPAIVGASLGGLSGMLAEGESRRRLCRNLVLVDIAPRWREQGVARILQFMRARPEGFENLEDAARAVARYLPHREPRSTVEGLRPYLKRTAQGRLAWHWDPALLEQVDHQADAYYPRLIAAARMLTCPTLVVTGENSDVVHDEDVRDFLRAVPHADQVCIPGATHMVVGDALDAFSEAVTKFLDEHYEPVAKARPARSAMA